MEPSLTIILITQLLFLACCGAILWWTKGYAKKTGEYKADFENLPELTRKIDDIKSEIHRSTELQLGFKGEERKAIFEIADAISNAINYCLHTNTFIIDDSDNKQVQQTINEVWNALRQLTIAQTKFEILCESEFLKEAVSDVISSIHHELVPNIHPFLFGIIYYNNKVRNNEKKQDLLFDGSARNIDQIKFESDKLMEEHAQLLQERLREAKTHANKVLSSYRAVVGPHRKKFIRIAHSYLKQLMSTTPLTDSENTLEEDKIFPKEEIRSKGLSEPKQTLLDGKMAEKISVSTNDNQKRQITDGNDQVQIS